MTKAKKQKQAENTQFHVSVARHNIRAVNSELDALIASLRETSILQNRVRRGFDGSAPTLVSSAAQSAKKAIESTQEKL